MKFALAQINTTVGDFEGNLRRIRRFVDQASVRGASLVVFPEMTLTGYPPRDLLENAEFIEKNLKALEDVQKLSASIDIVVGFIRRNSSGTGKPLFNSAALCRKGAVAGIHDKVLLPTYDVFDEGRYFEPGSEPLVHEGVGISICEDIWNDRSFWKERLYNRDPVEEQVRRGADLLINISASPFSAFKEDLRCRVLRAVARRHGKPLFYVNLVGGNDELVFDGRSLVLNSGGDVVAMAKAFEEELVVVDGDTMEVPATDAGDVEERELVGRALVTGLRDYVRKCGFKKVVLGLSGGIDSSLVAVLAVKALGSKNVVGVSMPSPYSSRGSLEDARALAKNLGIQHLTCSISSIYASYRKLFKRGSKSAPDLADENTQARIRGNILMTLSNRHGYLVLSTGNKSELAVGYCTLYGDMSGGLALISDLPKTLVYEVARSLQRTEGFPIPEAVFTKPPSAELRPHQTDQDSLPSYDVLDGILKAVVEEHRSMEEIVALGYPRSVVGKVLKMVHRNEYKRRQAAPGIRVTSKAFGIGRRYPIARKI